MVAARRRISPGQWFRRPRVGRLVRVALIEGTVQDCVRERRVGTHEPNDECGDGRRAPRPQMSIAEDDQALSTRGLVSAFGRLRDPIFLLVAPVVFVLLEYFFAYKATDVGFDFAGTLWKPAHAWLDGMSIYPEPTRSAVEVGNPSVYPPLFILLLTPLTALPFHIAAWVWLGILAASVAAAMWIVGVRDWRCYVLAVTSPVVLQGLMLGNLTVFLVLLIALAWRYRDRAFPAGIAVGAAIAAKLFVWPLLVWLVLTRRYRAAVWALGSVAFLVLGSWAVVGFDGLLDYPALLRETQAVYATRSDSVASVVAGLGASTTVAVAACWVAGLALIGLAVWLSRQEDSDRRVFAALVAAGIVASPIAWPNYASLLLVPIAITWPRLAPAWFFGYAIWLAGLLPRPVATGAPGRPAGVPEMAWELSHAVPAAGKAAGIVGTVLAVTAALVVLRFRSVRSATP